MNYKPVNNKYPFQVWLTSIVLVAPALLFIAGFIYNPSRFRIIENLMLLMLFILCGIIYSIPSFLFSFLFFRMLKPAALSPVLIKLIFNILSFAGIFITFYFINGSFSLVFSLFYAASILISSLLFSVHKKESFDSEFIYAF